MNAANKIVDHYMLSLRKKANEGKTESNKAQENYLIAQKMGCRYLEGEEAISKSAIYSTFYAINVINGRFELGEEVISKSSSCSCIYAERVLGVKSPTMTAAQKHNARQDKIWEKVKILKAKYDPLNMLQRLTEKVERANSIQHIGGKINAEDWSELYALVNEAKAVIKKNMK